MITVVLADDQTMVRTGFQVPHLGRAMSKIGVRDRLQTVVWAYQNGVVTSTLASRTG